MYKFVFQWSSDWLTLKYLWYIMNSSLEITSFYSFIWTPHIGPLLFGIGLWFSMFKEPSHFCPCQHPHFVEVVIPCDSLSRSLRLRVIVLFLAIFFSPPLEYIDWILLNLEHQDIHWIERYLWSHIIKSFQLIYSNIK